MRQWFDADAPDSVSPVLFPTEVRELIQSQNSMGWRQILRGRLSVEWQRIQNKYYLQHRRKTAFKRTGERWQQQLIMVIWEDWFRLWTLRNGEVHGTTSATRAQAHRREVGRQLADIYASRTLMEPEVQQLLEEDQEKHMQRETHVTQNWLAMAGPVIRRSVRRIRKRSLEGVRAIRSYFPRTGDG
jgi:hypothetical protein